MNTEIHPSITPQALQIIGRGHLATGITLVEVLLRWLGGGIVFLACVVTDTLGAKADRPPTLKAKVLPR